MIDSSFLNHNQDPKGFSKSEQRKSHDTRGEPDLEVALNPQYSLSGLKNTQNLT